VPANDTFMFVQFLGGTVFSQRYGLILGGIAQKVPLNFNPDITFLRYPGYSFINYCMFFNTLFRLICIKELNPDGYFIN
jgi:hypothetical protein